MQRVAETFAAALAADLITADDFSHSRRAPAEPGPEQSQWTGPVAVHIGPLRPR